MVKIRVVLLLFHRYDVVAFNTNLFTQVALSICISIDATTSDKTYNDTLMVNEELTKEQ